MSDELLGLLDRVLVGARRGEGVEAFGVDETETSVKAYGGQVEALTSARSRGVGVRVMAAERAGYAYTADLRDGLHDVLEQARANAAAAAPDEANILPDALPVDPLPELADERFGAIGVDEKVAAALSLEQAAVGRDPRVTRVDAARYGDAVRDTAIASTTGVRGGYRRTQAYAFVEAIADGDEGSTSALGLRTGRVLHDLDLEAAAAEASDRAARVLGGRKPPSDRMPVVLDPFATAAFLGVLAGALTAEAVQKGRSLFADRVGDAVGARPATLVDDGRLLQGLSAAPWDDEGVPTGRTTLIDGGVLRGFLHNTYTAAKAGTVSTGNAGRGGFASSPGVGPTNLFLMPGPQPPAELLAGAGDGFYCQSVLGVHSGANPVTGDFSVGATGLMIRDGGLAEPVREVTVAGTIPQMLTDLRAVADDLRFLPFGGASGGTTVLVGAMTLAGS
ncbi:MAG: TldD/PmbA family protein [Actinomycetota bacterium]|nr:TldD/PmbA family protein [Actinomycetota bacterium]